MLKIVPTPEFSKQVKKLSKSYKQIADDLVTLKNELISNPRSGIDLGRNCYKIRLANSSIPTGKSGGFRVITYYFDQNETIRLLLIYSKTQQDSVSTEEILDVLKRNNL
jgi:mRNA-degrading endonuclease RelE of RelBE toxin-antitoxin system